MYRIKQYEKGWVVEINRPRRFGLFRINNWVHFISVSGISENPWYHSSFDSAMDSLLHKIKWQTIDNSPFIPELKPLPKL